MDKPAMQEKTQTTIERSPDVARVNTLAKLTEYDKIKKEYMKDVIRSDIKQEVHHVFGKQNKNKTPETGPFPLSSKKEIEEYKLKIMAEKEYAERVATAELKEIYAKIEEDDKSGQETQPDQN